MSAVCWARGTACGYKDGTKIRGSRFVTHHMCHSYVIHGAHKNT